MIAVYDKLIYFNEASKYTILRMRTDDPSVPEEARSQYTFRDQMLRFTAVGYGLPQTDSVKLEIEGDWKEGKYGLQLHVEHWHELVPPTTEGLLSYLSSGLGQCHQLKTIDGLFYAKTVEMQPQLVGAGLCSARQNAVNSFENLRRLRKQLPLWM